MLLIIIAIITITIVIVIIIVIVIAIGSSSISSSSIGRHHRRLRRRIRTRPHIHTHTHAIRRRTIASDTTEPRHAAPARPLPHAAGHHGAHVATRRRGGGRGCGRRNAVCGAGKRRGHGAVDGRCKDIYGGTVAVLIAAAIEIGRGRPEGATKGARRE